MIIKRGQIYNAILPNGIGSEQNGVRPVLIVQNDTGNFYGKTVIVIPITSEIKKLNMPTHMIIDAKYGLAERSMLIAEQITTIDKRRIREYIGTISNDFMNMVEKLIDISLGINREYNRFELETEPKSKALELCLCHKCLGDFIDSKAYYVERKDYGQTEKDTCTYCQQRNGYDYLLHKKKKQSSQAKRQYTKSIV